MRAAFLTGIREIDIREIPLPHLPSENEVRLRMTAAGICGSDIHYYTRGGIGDQRIEYPFIIGHECAGTVESIGAGVRHLRPGDRVAVDPAISCGTCDQCLAGRPHTCRRLRFLGSPGQMAGCLAEHLVMPARSCHRLPTGMSDIEGVLIEPLSIGIYALELYASAVGERTALTDSGIGILGSGPIGLSLLLAARAGGADRVYATDRLDERCRTASDAGAIWSANPDKTDVTDEILKRETAGLDAVFECSGDPTALDQAVDLLKPGGSLLIVGIPEADRISFDINRLRRKEIRILNVRRQNHSTDKAIALAASSNPGIAFLATHRFPLEKTAEAFELAAGYRDGVLKAVIEFPAG